jgi:hypothetical protein
MGLLYTEVMPRAGNRKNHPRKFQYRLGAPKWMAWTECIMDGWALEYYGDLGPTYWLLEWDVTADVSVKSTRNQRAM